MSAIDKLEKVDVVVDGNKISIVGGSFKGVPFFVDDFELDGNGRNVVSRSIPFSSNYVNQDQGGKIPQHSINVYFVGDECKESRDSFIAVCNEEGPGELVHPFFGRFDANCVGLKISGSRSGLNYCTATVEFRPIAPVQAEHLDLSGAVKVIAKEAESAAVDKFCTVFSVINKAKSAVDAAVDVTDRAVDSVLESRASLASANDFVSELGKIKSNVQILMLAPADFSARLRNVLDATAEIFGVEKSGNDVDEYSGILDKMMDDKSDDSPAGAIAAMLKIILAARLAESLVGYKFSNVEEAKDYQNKISDLYDRLLDGVSDMDDYMTISNLQANALGYLRESMENVAVVLEKTVVSSVNILQLCYDVYGSLDKVDDILERNSLPQGLFVLPGKVKVLSR